MRIADYLPNSVVDGVGVRQVFFTQGCEHHCKGCQNPQTWDMDGGKDWPIHTIVSTILASPFQVTFSGGDPLYQPKELLEVLKRIRPEKNVWVYTGYTFEVIQANPELSILLPHIDVLVDGQYVEQLRSEKLQFRGSSNQRIIDVQRSLQGEVVLWREGHYA